MIDLRSLYLEETEELFKERSIPRFRAEQIFSRIHKNLASSFEEMTNIPLNLKEKLSSEFYISRGEILKKILSSDNTTRKYLFEFENNTIIEGVLMKYSYGYAACISTQAGCSMGCSFCASAIGGKMRDLTAGEMAEEVYLMCRDIGERVGHVVLMGSGEPLENYDETVKFIRLINSPKGYNLSQRKITLSTCGLTDKILRLAEENLQITLAVSLHAPNDGIRNKIMPVSKKHPMDGLLSACREYSQKTGRRVTFEYALMKEINDSRSCAKELAGRLKNTLSHVNLIPVNEVEERKGVIRTSSQKSIKDFYCVLENEGIPVTVRRELGSDINAACGQLKAGYDRNNAQE